MFFIWTNICHCEIFGTFVNAIPKKNLVIAAILVFFIATEVDHIFMFIGHPTFEILKFVILLLLYCWVQPFMKVGPLAAGPGCIPGA